VIPLNIQAIHLSIHATSAKLLLMRPSHHQLMGTLINVTMVHLLLQNSPCIQRPRLTALLLRSSIICLFPPPEEFLSAFTPLQIQKKSKDGMDALETHKPNHHSRTHLKNIPLLCKSLPSVPMVFHLSRMPLFTLATPL
jgi:hypothetical protein